MMAVADYWWWLTAGMVLMVLEIVTPGVFFMWIGIGALITGLVAWIVPAASPAVLGTLPFCASSPFWSAKKSWPDGKRPLTRN